MKPQAGALPGRMRVIASCVCVLVLPVCHLSAMDRGIWDGNPGVDATRAYPNEQVPTDWDAASGRNIRWKTALPNWSNGSPIMVGGKVFLMSEPIDYAPILTCIAAETGKVLWQKDVDAVDAFPGGEQVCVRQLARETWTWNRQVITLWNDVAAFLKQRDPKLNLDNPPRPDEATVAVVQTAFASRFEELGLAPFKGLGGGAGGPQARFDLKDRSGIQARRMEETRKAGLAWVDWTYYGTWVGSTFGTPASDGQRVFVGTGNNYVACYDLAGNRLWHQRFPWLPDRRDVAKSLPEKWYDRAGRTTDDKGRERFRWPYSSSGWFATSPVCADGRFVWCGGAWIRCFDARTGNVVWDMPLSHDIGQNCMMPGLIELSGESFVIVPASGPGQSGDEIIRLRDGKICGILPGFSSSKMQIGGPLVAGDLVISNTGVNGPEAVAHRLAYDKETEQVQNTQLWIVKPQRNLFRVSLVGERLHAGGQSFDAISGKELGRNLPAAPNNYCWRSELSIGSQVLSIDHSGGTFVFRDAVSGKGTGRATLPKHNPEIYDAPRVRAQVRGERWAVFGAATPVAWKNRLYVRGFDYLYCIEGGKR